MRLLDYRRASTTLLDLDLKDVVLWYDLLLILARPLNNKVARSTFFHLTFLAPK